MRVACLMPTYNRVHGDRLELVEEAMGSYVRQDYDKKTLVICNDTPGQQLYVDKELREMFDIRIHNLDYRFPSLSAKLIWMIENTTDADAFCRWDDDDICLSHRLSYSVAKLGNRYEWRATNYFYVPQNRAIEVDLAGNTHTMSIWTRDCLKLIGGYPPDRHGDEDQMFNKRVDDRGIGNPERIPYKDIFYLYRWGPSPVHLSGHGADPQTLKDHWDRIGSNPIVEGTFAVEPGWKRNWYRYVQERGAPLPDSNIQKRTAVSKKSWHDTVKQAGVQAPPQ